jgi:tetratricopeptide (TPR) repeat protein
MAKSRKEWDNTALDALDIMKEESSVSPPLKSWLAKTKVRMAEQYLLENSVSGLSDELVANTLNKFGPTGTREALFNAGVKLTNERKFEQANKYYNKILNLKTDINQEKYERSLAYHLATIELDPDLIWQIVANYSIGYDYRMLGGHYNYKQWSNYQKAVDIFTKVIELSDKIPKLWITALARYELCKTYFLMGKDENKGYQQLNTILEQFNNSIPIYDRTGIIYQKERKFLPASLFHLGGFANREGNYDEARKYYEQIIKEYPESETAKSAKIQLQYLELNKFNKNQK